MLAGVHGAGGCTFVSSLATCSGGSSLEGSRVRGFEGSIPAGPHPEGIIGPRGLVTSKRSSPEAYS